MRERGSNAFLCVPSEQSFLGRAILTPNGPAKSLSRLRVYDGASGRLSEKNRVRIILITEEICLSGGSDP